MRGRMGDLLAAVPTDASSNGLADSIAELAAERDELERRLRRELTARGANLGAIPGEGGRGGPARVLGRARVRPDDGMASRSREPTHRAAGRRDRGAPAEALG